MKYTNLFILFLVLIKISSAQNEDRKFEHINQTDQGLEIFVSDGKYDIQFYTDHIVETTFIPKGETVKQASHAIVLKPRKVEIIPIITNDESVFFTKGIAIKIQEQPFQISYSYKGNSVISEKAGYVKNDSLETIQFNLTKDEVLYGGGARALGMNRRGNHLQLYNKAHYGYETHSELMNFTLPIVMSSKKYMVHFDNAPIGFLDLDSKKDNTLTYETISGRKTYQVIVGDTWYDLTNNYTKLTGKQPMPPRWALGNFSSRFGYHSQEETEATISKFKNYKIPVDAIILDLYWFGKEVQGTMGNLEVFRDSFPDFEGMVSRLKDKGVKTIMITEPFILTTSKRWNEAVKEDVLAKDSLGHPYTYDFYFGNTGLIDIYKPKAEAWFWNIYKGLANKGVAGIWGDLGEPEVHPTALIHETGTADEVHNIYGHDWARLIHEGYKRDFPNKRPFILMRAGYSGSQRYGLIPWSGDVNRTWGGLQSQPEIALQMGMQGLGYMHSDLGGFAGANLDDELYIRWLQYGVFQPIYRPHAQEEIPSEPVFRSDKARELAKQSIELRYKLLPYNYNLVYQNNQEGTPLMRPLFFEESSNQLLQDYSKTYLWGYDFLVSPILEAGKKEQLIYFPKMSNWFDFYTDEKIKGGQTKSIKTKENSIPTFVRAGAFIPVAEAMNSTEDYSANALEIHYYYDATIKESTRKIYNDDGATAEAIEKGLYELLKFESNQKKSCLEIRFEAEIGKHYKPSTKQIKLIIHNIENRPKRVKAGNKRVNIQWDSENNRVSIPIVWNTSEKKDIKIKLKQ
ncbi:TIM-barrel domain-containing protein [Flavivirga abyssicola]|uniref:TIM-barrel domain-containing protein n=1 Tax=Flavivirga abyssicola TaxID=3063533 RepID=UPI0026E09A9E|nr:TIM-barrel domain-containing protein [Flavivirga sp. MEBiC07777]WVK13697.1 TIM-barrel domain-containing protein [Flavivirga sp. MEBiC07777]